MKTIGWHRQVRVYQKHVIKIARNKVFVHCNKLEAQLSGTSEYLAEVHGVSDDFTVLQMERVQIPPFRKRLEYTRFLKKELKGMSDVHWYNVGEKNGRPVLYDYGGTLVTWKLFYRWLKNEGDNRETQSIKGGDQN